jgi:hypothetical protein
MKLQILTIVIRLSDILYNADEPSIYARMTFSKIYKFVLYL